MCVQELDHAAVLKETHGILKAISDHRAERIEWFGVGYSVRLGPEVLDRIDALVAQLEGRAPVSDLSVV